MNSDLVQLAHLYLHTVARARAAEAVIRDLYVDSDANEAYALAAIWAETARQPKPMTEDEIHDLIERLKN